MHLCRHTARAAVLFAISVAPAAALTADEVWADWQRLAATRQLAVTATPTRTGDSLVLTDITLPLGPPDDQVAMTIPRIDLQDMPDGRVKVLLPAQFPIVIADTDTGKPGAKTVILAASAPDFSMIIAGLGDTATFEVAAPSIVISLDRIEPALLAGERVDVNIAIADLVVQHRMDLTQPTQTVFSMANVGTVHGDVTFDTEDTASGKGTMSTDLATLAWSLNLVIPPSGLGAPLPDDGNPLPMILKAFADGLVVDGALTYGAFALNADVTEGSEKTRVDFTSASGRGVVKLDPTAIVYDIAVGKTALAVDGPPGSSEVPKAAMSVSEFGYGASVGIGDLVTPQDARVTMRLVDLVMSPEMWVAMDPGSVFEPSPLTFVLDVAGRYKLSPEMLTPEWRPTPGEMAPVDIVDATLSDLRIAAFGINVTGTGSLTFDETDLVTYDGIPAPLGKVSLQATGVNALIDRLVAAGKIPPDALTGVRMGLAMTFKPGTEPDTLVSEAEFRETGFFLNGLQMR